MNLFDPEGHPTFDFPEFKSGASRAAHSNAPAKIERPKPKPILHSLPQRSLNSAVSSPQWQDWNWHVRNRITTIAELEKWIPLSVEEKRAVQFSEGRSYFSITPYWASLMDPNDLSCPIRRQTIPIEEEFRVSSNEAFVLQDPSQKNVNGRLTHVYPDRAVLSVHSQCIVYCRFCPQKKIPDPKNSGSSFAGIPVISEEEWQEVEHYLHDHTEIREIIITGGEPLLLTDTLLLTILTRLKSIPAIKSLRLETRMASVLPQRITPELIGILKRFQPLYLVLNTAHPKEMTKEFRKVCKQLIDSGIPVVSQTVLLRNINDKPQTLSKLFSDLYHLRVRPYRVIQCRLSEGTDHFRTSLSLGLKLMESLRGRMPGLALPEYVVDTMGGKIPLKYESILSRNKKQVLLKNHEGRVFVYPEKNISNSP
jgi:lysine 2,3-aminomutase